MPEPACLSAGRIDDLRNKPNSLHDHHTAERHKILRSTAGELPEANGVDCVGDELAATEGYARCLAAPLYALGGPFQLLLVQPADLDLQGEGCHCTNAAHRFCCRLIGGVKKLACLYSTHTSSVKATVLSEMSLLEGTNDTDQNSPPAALRLCADVL